MKRSEALEILGLSGHPSDDQVNKAWRAMVRKVHPDLFPNDPQKQAWATEQTKLVNEAHDVLIDGSWEPETSSSARTSSSTSSYGGSSSYSSRSTSQSGGSSSSSSSSSGSSYGSSSSGSSSYGSGSSTSGGGGYDYDSTGSSYSSSTQSSGSQHVDNVESGFSKYTGVFIKLGISLAIAAITGPSDAWEFAVTFSGVYFLCFMATMVFTGFAGGCLGWVVCIALVSGFMSMAEALIDLSSITMAIGLTCLCIDVYTHHRT